MKNKQKTNVLLLLLALVMVLGGCSKPEEVKGEIIEEEVKIETFSFTDSLGTTFELEKPLEKVVILNRQTALAMKILGVDDKVLATGDTTVENNPYLGYDDRTDLGKLKELNMEALISLEPDAVFCHTNRMVGELEEKLEPLNIPVIRIDNYQPEKFEEELLLLASIFDVTEKAEEYISYRNEVESLVEERTKDIPEEDKKSVMALSVGFLNSDGGYRIFPAFSTEEGEMGVGEGYSTILAGGKEASDVKWDPKESSTTILVEEEYALSCTPEVLTLHGTWLGGYEEDNEEVFKEVIDNIYEISSINQMPAGKNREVYIFHTDMLGAANRHIGLLQLGKYLYPELFEDINVEEYAAEYFEKWLGTEYSGMWFYSAK